MGGLRIVNYSTYLSELDGGLSLIDPGVSTPKEMETDGSVPRGIETVQLVKDVKVSDHSLRRQRSKRNIRRGRIATKQWRQKI